MSRTAGPGTSPRGALIARLERRARLFPDLPFDQFEAAELDVRDSKLLRAIDAAVTRRWLTLVAVLESRIDREWPSVEPALQAALLVGAAQLLFFDRVPDHAAVDESVAHAKRTRGPRAAGFVNAILRAVAGLRSEQVDATQAAFAAERDLVPLSDGRGWRLREQVFAEDPVTRLGQVASVGGELLRHWISAHGFRVASDLARHGLVDAPLVVTDVPPELSCDARLVAHERDGFHVYTGEMDDLVEMLVRSPGMRVQDSASSDPVQAARRAGIDPKVVVDLCAGRGTKTVQLAVSFPAARIVATDIDDGRRRDLVATSRRHAAIEVIDPRDVSRLFRSADLVVLDVPCSNTAVLPRRPEATYRFSARRLEQLVATQREILAGAMPLLAPRGHLLYATCSLEPAENARQAAAARKRFGLVAVAERQHFPTGAPGDPPTRYADGGFWSLMRAADPQGR